MLMTNTNKLSSSAHDALKSWLQTIPVGRACRKQGFPRIPQPATHPPEQ